MCLIQQHLFYSTTNVPLSHFSLCSTKNEKQLEIIVNVVIVIIKVLRALNLSVTHSAYYHRDRCVRRSVHALQNRLHLRIGNLHRNHVPQK